MNNQFNCASRFAPCPSLIFFAVVVVTSGCGELAEQSAERAKAKELFEALNAECPKRINDYTTLKRVTYGLGQVEYRYEVSESGRSIVYLSNKWMIKKGVLKATKATPAGGAIKSLDLDVSHVYKDTDGKQLLSFSVNKRDLKNFKIDPNDTLDVTPASLSGDQSVVDMRSELKNLKHRPSRAQAKAWFNALNKECPKKINDHTTLKYVKFTGTNRIEYRYEVTKAGIPTVNLDFHDEMRQATATEMKASRYGDAVMALDMSAMHVYKDTQDRQMLSYMITRKELRDVANQPSNAADESSEEKPHVAQSEPDDEKVTDVDKNTESVANETVEEPQPQSKPKSKAKWGTSKPRFAPITSNPAGVQTNPYVQ